LLEQRQHTLTIATHGPGFTDLTDRVSAWLASIGAGDGLLTLFVRHTSASLTIQENADPDVLRDLAFALDRLAPRGARYAHDIEGPGVPVTAGRMVLGTWQALYLIEHRDAPHTREVVLHYLGTRRA
jgi:thiamine phosphate synthase YjbQ (UPF0047 family)